MEFPREMCHPGQIFLMDAISSDIGFPRDSYIRVKLNFYSGVQMYCMLYVFMYCWAKHHRRAQDGAKLHFNYIIIALTLATYYQDC